MRHLRLVAQRLLQVHHRLLQKRPFVQLDLGLGQAYADQRRPGQDLDRGAVGVHGLALPPRIPQDVAAQLVQERVLRLLRDQRIEDGEGLLGAALLHEGDRARVLRLHAGIVRLVAPERIGGIVEEAVQLALHPRVRRDEVRRRRHVGIARMRDVVLHEPDAVRGQRVRSQIGIAVRAVEDLFPLQGLHELEQAARRLMAGFEELDARLVGRLLHAARIAENAALADLRAAEDCRADAFRPPGRSRGGAAEHRGDDRLGGRRPHPLPDARQVSAGDVAGFVGEHADHLTRVLRLLQQPGVDEDLHPAGDEGIQPFVPHQVYLHRGNVDPGRPEHWRGVNADGIFDFRIADKRNALGRGASGQHQKGNRRQNQQTVGQ